ncbi:MBOAT family protein [Leptolyngbya sp. FACHB-261]|nr:MBOAT family protein [Leptolyngbya sp. FACHB-261]
MNFLSPQYALFLGLVSLLYWQFRPIVARLSILLLASLLFYASFQVRFVPLLLALTGLTFWLGQQLATDPPAPPSAGEGEGLTPVPEENVEREQAGSWRRRLILLLGVGAQVLLLLLCKYAPLGAEGKLIMPLALSFFAFECIAYLVDVYRGAAASQTFLRFATYKLFFPKLISGPITRYQTFAAQYHEGRSPGVSRYVDGLWWIACGALKKGLVADHLGQLVDLTFENLERAGSGDLWLALVGYAFQVYLDFSGYTDMARGSALLLGFELPPNFDFPYLSTSIADFWRRWHITLGDWLRHYVYFPLGGSRRGLVRTCFNLMLVMLVAGLWHGNGAIQVDNWAESTAGGFLLWGVLHGGALVAHRLTVALSAQVAWLASYWQSPIGQLSGWGLTQSLVLLAWIPFRLPNLGRTELVFTRLWGHSADAQFAQKVYQEAIGLSGAQIWLLLIAIALGMTLVGMLNRGAQRQLSWPLRAFLVPLCLYAVWLLRPAQALRYIYFDF